LWNSLQKWQRWTLALSWRNPASGACLLRSFKFLLGGENICAAASESDWISELGKGAHGHRSMLQYVLLIQRQAEALHVFDTSKRKLKNGADPPAKIDPAQRVKTFTTRMSAFWLCSCSFLLIPFMPYPIGRRGG
jgi:hypothetical protein